MGTTGKPDTSADAKGVDFDATTGTIEGTDTGIIPATVGMTYNKFSKVLLRMEHFTTKTPLE